MPKKSTEKTASKKGGSDQHNQATTTPRGREHTIGQGVRATKISRKHAATREEPAVELLIDQKGIHSLTAGATPVEAPQLAKAKETKLPAQTGGAPEQADDSGELVVFAFRLSRAERDLIHQAAGSAKASKFVRGLAVAAARGDGDAVQRILEECRPVRP